MKDIEQVKASESLLKNLMWLERGNPLANHYELLETGLSISQRIRELYKMSGEFYANEVLPFKTLSAAMRYVIEREIEYAVGQQQPPRIMADQEQNKSVEKAFTTLSRGDKLSFTIAMQSGRS